MPTGLTTGLSPQQMEQLMYPYGRGQYSYGSTPIMLNQGQTWQNQVQPGGVSGIGGIPVQTGIAANTGDGINASLGVSPGALPATGLPAGATASPAAGYSSLAGAAIGQIAQTASDYVQRNAQVQGLKGTSAIPAVPQGDDQFVPLALSIPRIN